MAPDFPIEDTEPVDSLGSARRFVDDLTDMDALPPTVLVAPIEGLEPTEDTETFLVVRVLGVGGGPIEGRLVLREGRVRVVAPAGLVVVDGVPLREGLPLDEAVASCFVGDLVGDLATLVLEVRFGRGPGLGLGAFKLILLAGPVSAGAGLRVVDELRLVGLVLTDLLKLDEAGLDGGGGWAMTLKVVGLTNMPYPISQWK